MKAELTAYLLGNLPEDRRETVAALLFTQPDLVTEMEALEVDLIDRFARGELGAAEAQNVRARLLSSEYGMDQLRVAEGFAAQARKRQKTQSRVRICAAIVACAMVLAGGAFTYTARQKAAPPTVSTAVIVLPLSTVRGDAHVAQIHAPQIHTPQIHTPQGEAVRFAFNGTEEFPAGSVAYVHTPDRGELQLPIRTVDRSFSLGAAPPAPGRYEWEVNAGRTLIAAGEFDLLP